MRKVKEYNANRKEGAKIRKMRFKFKNRVEILSQIKSIDYIIKQNSNDPSKLIDIIRNNIFITKQI